MATLDTNRLQLAQLQRRRAIADAMTAQALKPRQIIHPYQGMAQLAEALVGGLMRNSTNKREMQLAEERRQAMVEALGPQTEEFTIPQERTASPVQQQQLWQDPAQAGMPVPQSSPVGQNVEVTTPGILNQQQLKAFMALPPDLQDSVWAQTVLHSLTPDPTKPTDPYDNIGVRQYAPPGEEPRDIQVFREARGPGARVGTIGSDGQFYPVDSRYLSDTVKRQADVTPPLKGNDYESITASVVEAATAFDQIDRLRMNIEAGALTPDSFIGGIRDWSGRVMGTFRALGETFTGVVEHDAAMQRYQSYGADGSANWGGVMSEYGKALDEGGRRYTKAEINANRSFLEWFVTLDASAQQNAISLAYTLARIADPGGRLSEMDVINQMRGLQLNNPNKLARMQALGDAERTFAIQLKRRLEMMQARAAQTQQSIFVPRDIQQRLDDVTGPLARPGSMQATFEEALSDPANEKFLGDELVEIMRNSSATVRRQFERQGNLPEGFYDYVIDGR